MAYALQSQNYTSLAALATYPQVITEKNKHKIFDQTG